MSRTARMLLAYVDRRGQADSQQWEYFLRIVAAQLIAEGTCLRSYQGEKS